VLGCTRVGQAVVQIGWICHLCEYTIVPVCHVVVVVTSDMMNDWLVVVFWVYGDVYAAISSSYQQHTHFAYRSEGCELGGDNGAAHVVPLGVQAVTYAARMHLKGVH